MSQRPEKKFNVHSYVLEKPYVADENGKYWGAAFKITKAKYKKKTATWHYFGELKDKFGQTLAVSFSETRLMSPKWGVGEKVAEGEDNDGTNDGVVTGYEIDDHNRLVYQIDWDVNRYLESELVRN